MPTLVQLLAPLALLLAPTQSASVAGHDSAGALDTLLDGAGVGAWSLALRIEGPPLLPVERSGADPRAPETWNQVSIEQHLIIRIYPGQVPRSALFGPPPPATPQRPPDRRQIRCVALGALGGLRLTGPNQLTLILRDNRMIQATLPRICSASAFYSGFYVEPTPDGMLCARRDVIHSRAGSNCSISRLDIVSSGN